MITLQINMPSRTLKTAERSMLVSFFAPGSFLGLYIMAAVTRMNTGSHCEHTKHLIDTSAFPGYTSSFQSPKLELFR